MIMQQLNRQKSVFTPSFFDFFEQFFFWRLYSSDNIAS